MKNNQNLNILPLPEIQTIALNIMVFAGSINETTQNNGISHLLEHLIVTQLRESNKKNWITSYYVDQLNATTLKDRTEYSTVLTNTDENKLIEVIEAITNFKIPSLEIFENEKEVIKEELQEDEEGQEHLLYVKEEDWLYKNTPLSFAVGGTVKSVKNLTLKQLKDYYYNYYIKDRITISVVGNISKSLQLKLQNIKFNRSKANLPSTEFHYKNGEEYLLLQNKKQQVNRNDNWFMKINNFEEVIKFEFFIAIVNYYLYYLLRDKGICYYFQASSNIYIDHVEAVFNSTFDKSKMNAYKKEVFSFLNDPAKFITNSDLNEYKNDSIQETKIDTADINLLAHRLSWYKQNFDVVYDVKVVENIISNITIKDIVNFIEQLQMSKPGKVLVRGSIKNI